MSRATGSFRSINDNECRRDIKRPDGHPLDIGRKTRAIPIAIQRALKARDGGCRFPGCTHTRYTEGHHDNLVTLCHFHHHLVHEGGYGIERTEARRFRFRRADGTPIEDSFLIEKCFRGNILTERNAERGITVGPDTIDTRWGGERMDYGIAIGALVAARERPQERSPVCGAAGSRSPDPGL